ncbi:MAG: branched-chain amino acid ABC transporter permease [Thaumarchaeota archaeon]|nr:branched-chain amino acid ABC transporter permease [Nitrososphaerota archaeon]
MVSTTVVYGSLFGLMCVGLTMTYLTTKVPNFAHASFVVVGLYASYSAFWLLKITPYLTLPVSFLAGGISAVLLYVLLLRPLRNRGATIVHLMIASFAADIIITALIQIFADFLNSNFGSKLFAKGFNPYQIFTIPDFQIAGIHGLTFTAPVALVSITLSLYFLLTRTRLGVAMRAAIENPDLAKVVGIDIERVYLLSWFLAGSLAGISGTFWVLYYGANPNLSTALIVTIFSGSVLGGLGSIYGAVVGGLIVGGAENAGTTLLQGFLTSHFGSSIGQNVSYFQKGIPFGIMILVLLFMPHGIVSVDWRRKFRRIVSPSRGSEASGEVRA